MKARVSVALLVLMLALGFAGSALSCVAGGNFCGVHDITGAAPRTIRGVTGPTAKASFPPRACSAGAMVASARLSQPVSLAPGFTKPLSSTS